MSKGIDIFREMMFLIFCADASAQINTSSAIYETVLEVLKEMATRSDERVWSDIDQYVTACQYVGEPSGAVLYGDTTPGLCWTETVFDTVVVPNLGQIPMAVMDMFHTEMRGYIHYNAVAAAQLIWESCAACGLIPTVGMVHRYATALIAHERHHATQDVEWMLSVITTTDINSDEYQCQEHEAAANAAALAALQAMN